MNYKDIVELITRDSQEVDTLIKELSKYNEQTLPSIYVDLMISKVKVLYLELTMLNKSPEELFKMKLSDPQPEIKIQQISAVIPSILTDVQIEQNGIEHNLASEKTPAITQIVAPVVVPHFVQEDKDSLRRKRDQHFLSTQLKFDAIPDMKSSININDKIWFIKELFQGNIELYNRSIDLINGMKNIEEVFEYIDQNFSWEYDNKTIKKFYEIVYRRFI